MIAAVKDDLSDHTMQPGDRVEIFKGNEFGIIIAVRGDGEGLFLQVARGDGSLRWLRQAQAWYAPPPEVLSERLETIQSEWTPADRLRRLALANNERDREPLTVPVVHDEWDASLFEYGGVI